MTPEPMLWFTGELVDCTASSANISEEDSNVVDTEDDDSQCCCPDTVQEPPPFIHDCRFLSHTSTAMPCAAEKLQASSTSRTTVSQPDSGIGRKQVLTVFTCDLCLFAQDAWISLSVFSETFVDLTIVYTTFSHPSRPSRDIPATNKSFANKSAATQHGYHSKYNQICCCKTMHQIQLEKSCGQFIFHSQSQILPPRTKMPDRHL